MTPFDILGIIYEKKSHDRDEVLADYNAFVINRGLSFNNDTIFFANEINRHYGLDKDQMFDFYMTAIPKGRRYGKWQKKDINNSDVEMLRAYYGVNSAVAEQYLSLMTGDALDSIRTRMIKGGVNAK